MGYRGLMTTPTMERDLIQKLFEGRNTDKVVVRRALPKSLDIGDSVAVFLQESN